MATEIYRGGCLCGHIRFAAEGPAEFPHYCSCRDCQRHTGAPRVAWVEFSRDRLRWTGAGGAPATYRSSEQSARAFCPRCGSSLGAVDDAPVIALLIGTFDDLNAPGLQPLSHSFADGQPAWDREPVAD